MKKDDKLMQINKQFREKNVQNQGVNFVTPKITTSQLSIECPKQFLTNQENNGAGPGDKYIVNRMKNQNVIIRDIKNWLNLSKQEVQKLKSSKSDKDFVTEIPKQRHNQIYTQSKLNNLNTQITQTKPNQSSKFTAKNSKFNLQKQRQNNSEIKLNYFDISQSQRFQFRIAQQKQPVLCKKQPLRLMNIKQKSPYCFKQMFSQCGKQINRREREQKIKTVISDIKGMFKSKEKGTVKDMLMFQKMVKTVKEYGKQYLQDKSLMEVIQLLQKNQKCMNLSSKVNVVDDKNVQKNRKKEKRKKMNLKLTPKFEFKQRISQMRRFQRAAISPRSNKKDQVRIPENKRNEIKTNKILSVPTIKSPKPKVNMQVNKQKTEYYLKKIESKYLYKKVQSKGLPSIKKQQSRLINKTLENIPMKTSHRPVEVSEMSFDTFEKKLESPKAKKYTEVSEGKKASVLKNIQKKRPIIRKINFQQNNSIQNDYSKFKHYLNKIKQLNTRTQCDKLFNLLSKLIKDPSILYKLSQCINLQLVKQQFNIKKQRKEEYCQLEGYQQNVYDYLNQFYQKKGQGLMWSLEDRFIFTKELQNIRNINLQMGKVGRSIQFDIFQVPNQNFISRDYHSKMRIQYFKEQDLFLSMIIKLTQNFYDGFEQRSVCSQVEQRRIEVFHRNKKQKKKEQPESKKIVKMMTKLLSYVRK